MAIFPSIFPNAYADPREAAGSTAPPPGGLSAPPQKKRMVQVRQGDRLYYYNVGSPEANQPGAVPVDVETVVTHGYSHPADPAQAAAQPAAPAPAPAAPAPAAPAPSLGTPPLGGSATPPQDQGGPNAQRSDQPGLEGSGPWVRVTPWDSGGDTLGVDIVRADSPAAAEARSRGVQPQPVRTGVRTVQGVAIPDELTMSSQFEGASRMLGSGQIIAWTAGRVPGENANQTIAEHKVTWRLANGAEQTFTFHKQGDNGRFMISGAPETNLAGVTSPEKANLERAQAAYYQAQARAQAADEAFRRNQISEQELKNASLARDEAEKAWNTAMGYGNVTHAEAVKNALTQAQVVQTGVQTQNTAAQTAATIQGTQNQTYQNVLQYYRDLTGDEAKAVELTLQYFNNRANVDANNNQTALAAGRAQVDAEQGANTQRVSLANNRLSQSNQGFSEDFRSANDLNQYLKPGSSKGADAFLALQAMRYRNAEKYGAFDVNDEDLVFNPERLPNSIRAFANPSNPSFAQYPTYDEMRTAADGMIPGRYGRPTPPSHTNVAQPATIPSANNVPGQPGAPRPGTAAAAQPPRPQQYPQAANPAPAGPPPKPVTAEQATGYHNQGVNPATGEPNDQRTAAVPTSVQSGYVEVVGADGVNGLVSAAQYNTWPAEWKAAYRSTGKTTDALPALPSVPDEDPVLYVRHRRSGVVRAARLSQINGAPDHEQFEVIDPNQGRPAVDGPGATETPSPSVGALPGASPIPSDAPDYGAPGMRVLPQPAAEQAPPSPVEPTSDAHYSYRPVNPPPAVEGPSPTLVRTERLLEPDPEEERRRRQREALVARYRSPAAIYGLFEGSFPEIEPYYA
jgi:hypothetical protein